MNTSPISDARRAPVGWILAGSAVLLGAVVLGPGFFDNLNGVECDPDQVTEHTIDPSAYTWHDLADIVDPDDELHQGALVDEMQRIAGHTSSVLKLGDVVIIPEPGTCNS